MICGIRRRYERTKQVGYIPAAVLVHIVNGIVYSEQEIPQKCD